MWTLFFFFDSNQVWGSWLLREDGGECTARCLVMASAAEPSACLCRRSFDSGLRPALRMTLQSESRWLRALRSSKQLPNINPSPAIKYRLSKGQRTVHHFQGIVIDMEFGNAGTLPCHIHAELAKPARQSAFIQQVDVSCQRYRVSGDTVFW